MAKKDNNKKKKKTKVSLWKRIFIYFMLIAMILSVIGTAIGALAK